MKTVSIGYDKELGELIVKGQTKETKGDMMVFWLSAVVGIATFIGFVWVAFIVLLR